jgi:LSD1 subclass zinc finger protein
LKNNGWQDITFKKKDMRANKILVIGSSNTDMVVKTQKLPLPGETMLGALFYECGGKGVTRCSCCQAVAMLH